MNLVGDHFVIEPQVAIHNATTRSEAKGESAERLKQQRLQFAEETAGVLRNPLDRGSRSADGGIPGRFAAALLTGNFMLWWARCLVLLTLGVSWGILRSSPKLNLVNLRSLEVVIIAAICSQMLMMMISQILHWYSQGDVTAIAAVFQIYLGGWSVMILTYGILFPNVWRRAAMLTFALSCLPYVAIGLLCWFVPALTNLLVREVLFNPIPLPFCCSLCRHVWRLRRRCGTIRVVSIAPLGSISLSGTIGERRYGLGLQS